MIALRRGRVRGALVCFRSDCGLSGFARRAGVCYHAPRMATHTTLTRLRWLLLFILTACLAAWPRPVAAQETGLSEVGNTILNAINQARAEAGLGALAVHPLLNQAAQGHVDDMITNYVYGHYGSDGSSVRTRVARTGYSATPWVSENWVSASSPDGAMRWWMNDYIHRVNILTPRWVEVGVGVGTRGSEMIFVTVFSAGGGNGDAVAVDAVAVEAVAVGAVAPQPLEQPSVRIQPQQVPSEGLDYAIQAGDTLLAVGLRYGLPWERIAEANGLSETSILQIGQVVRIPGSGEAATPAAPAALPVATEPYTVQAGDTLFSIALARGLIWQEVAAVNGFGAHTVLQIDQVIQVPQVEAAPAVEAAPVAEAAPLAPVMALAASAGLAPDPGLAPAPGVAGAKLPVHVVAAGDTIIRIAVKHNLDWNALMALNGLTETSILQVGQEIRLR